MRQSKVSVILLIAFAISVLAGGTVSTAFGIQRAQADDFAAKSSASLIGATELAEAIEDDFRRAGIRDRAAAQTVVSATEAFVSARFYCDYTGNGIAYGDTRWCDVSGANSSEVFKAEKAVTQTPIALGTTQREYDAAVVAQAAAVDAANEAAVRAADAGSAFSAAILYTAVLSFVLLLTAFAAIAFRRMRPLAASAH